VVAMTRRTSAAANVRGRKIFIMAEEMMTVVVLAVVVMVVAEKFFVLASNQF